MGSRIEHLKKFFLFPLSSRDSLAIAMEQKHLVKQACSFLLTPSKAPPLGLLSLPAHHKPYAPAQKISNYSHKMAVVLRWDPQGNLCFVASVVPIFHMTANELTLTQFALSLL